MRELGARLDESHHGCSLRSRVHYGGLGPELTVDCYRSRCCAHLDASIRVSTQM